MTDLAIIGGTGLASITEFTGQTSKIHNTVYGQTSGPLVTGTLSGKEIIFLARHGTPHTIPPHRVNYRANIRALKDCGINRIISINAVGGITAKMKPGAIVVPDQIIDYTWSRKHTFFSDGLDQVVHVDFTSPYCEILRGKIVQAASRLSLKIIEGATYGATQGPRLETTAEIIRMESDGCHLVGMTGMPEAALARELEMEYVSICLVVNRAAGKSSEIITMESIRSHLDRGMQDITAILKEVIKLL